ncbi:MAG: type II toxin-antitoxin system RelE/ParE family toxin [Candidatus Pacearchaeota archaeon]|nr:type II toxin-antitoxin system RelE/ParE family toxin [Candidatus Pacearchaeota archaeon]
MYEIILENPAEKFLKKLDKNTQRRIINKLKELQDNPLGIPLIGNLSGMYKLRIGDYRTIYAVKNEQLIILVLKIGHRKNVYGSFE